MRSGGREAGGRRRCATLACVIFLALFFAACGRLSDLVTDEKPQKILILYTNDEHGHILEGDGREKAVILDEMWREEERSCGDCTVIKVSGGDSYTGSAVSSVFKGRSTAEVMRAIGYEISGVGNHEFDYGLSEFEENRRASKMKYLSANIVTTKGQPAFPASEIIERNGARIAFIGVTTEELRQVAFAANLKDLRTVVALNAVQREVRRIKGQADIVVAIAHQSFESSREWFAALASEDRPFLVFNAHTHEEYVREIDGVYFLQAKKYLEKYARVEIVRKGGKFSVVDARIVTLRPTPSGNDPHSAEVRDLVGRYRVKMERLAGATLITAAAAVPTDRFMKLYACAVLDAFPDADVALSNPGAFRDDIRAGPVKVSDIISMLPFENRLVVSTIPGKDLIYNLNLSENAVCGMEKQGDQWHHGGSPLDPSQRYKAVIHEYIFAGGDYYKFTGESTQNRLTGTIWRVPLIKYLSAAGKDDLSFEEAYDNLMNKYGRR